MLKPAHNLTFATGDANKLHVYRSFPFLGRKCQDSQTSGNGLGKREPLILGLGDTPRPTSAQDEWNQSCRVRIMFGNSGTLPLTNMAPVGRYLEDHFLLKGPLVRRHVRG